MDLYLKYLKETKISWSSYSRAGIKNTVDNFFSQKSRYQQRLLGDALFEIRPKQYNKLKGCSGLHLALRIIAYTVYDSSNQQLLLYSDGKSLVNSNDTNKTERSIKKTLQHLTKSFF